MKKYAHVLVLAAAIAALGWVLFFAPGCNAVAHTIGVATTDDVQKEREDQAKIDKAITNYVADVFEGKRQPADMVNDAAVLIEKGVERTYQRTAPPVPQAPPGSPPWVELAVGVVALVSAEIARRAHVRSTVATQQAGTARIEAAETRAAVAKTNASLQETDDWVGELEAKHAAGAPTK